jgi:hypothetical protein
MRIIGNCRPVCGRLSFFGAALLLLGLSGFVLSCIQARREGPPDAAQQAPAGGKHAGAAKETDGWGPERDGLRTRLVPAQKEYVVGRPARFRLEMKNFGKHERTYDSQGVDRNGSMRISDPDGKPVPYVGGGFQTARKGEAPSIAPGETAVLFNGLDLTNQYLFAKAGSYTLQYRDTWDPVIPGSNTISVKMRPSTLPMSMQAPARLIDILPKEWSMSLNMRVAEVDRDGKITPPGRESGAGTYLELIRGSHKQESLFVPVWVSEHRLARKGTPDTGEASKPGEVAEYLGKGADGHVYWILEERIEKEWPGRNCRAFGPR